MNRRTFLRQVGLGTAALSLPLVHSGCPKRSHPPNIVYILADDLGYGDISCLNEHSKLNTNNIDRLAHQGVIFTDAHSGSAVCTPTRYGILTGRYSWRTRLKEGVLWGLSSPLIDSHRVTVASMLKSHGYHTACIGKWHLGLDWPFKDSEKKEVDFSGKIANGPTTLGFDYFFGITASLDIPPYVYIENDHVTALPDRETENKDYQAFWRKGATGADFRHIEVLPKMTQKSIEFINRQKRETPFFLYLALPAPHTPILPIEKFQNKSGTNPYGDFVLQVDDTVGQIMKALEQKSLDKNTLVIFTSDNGCSPRANYAELAKYGHNPSYVFRGHKADIFEGGHRIPFIARWPGRIQPGSTSNKITCLTDLMATVAAIIGEKLPANAAEDSYDILPTLTGQKPQNPVREDVVHHSINGSFSIRKGKWKLELCPGSGGWSHPRPGKETEGLPPIQLYDLSVDISERKNIYQDHPDVVDSLAKLLADYIKRGRSTPGQPQQNTGGTYWPQLKWLRENGYL